MNLRKKIRWSLERRFEFIEFRLFWDGRINRRDLVDFFGISTPQASDDLRRYELLAKGNLRYDKSAKTYIGGPSFRPKFLKPNASRFLNQLRLLADGALEADEAWLTSVPPFAVIPLVRRRLDAGKLRRILEAIRGNAAIRIGYQSFSHPQATTRWITPHALGFDGYRWHARAWCHEREGFRDFVLARMLELGETQRHGVDAMSDVEWQREVVMRIAPHPKMDEGPRRAIELDYGMVNGMAEIKTRICLAFYLERQLGLDLDPTHTSPERQQIILSNRTEIDEARESAKEEAASIKSRARIRRISSEDR